MLNKIISLSSSFLSSKSLSIVLFIAIGFCSYYIYDKETTIDNLKERNEQLIKDSQLSDFKVIEERNRCNNQILNEIQKRNNKILKKKNKELNKLNNELNNLHNKLNKYEKDIEKEFNDLNNKCFNKKIDKKTVETLKNIFNGE